MSVNLSGLVFSRSCPSLCLWCLNIVASGRLCPVTVKEAPALTVWTCWTLQQAWSCKRKGLRLKPQSRGLKQSLSRPRSVVYLKAITSCCGRTSCKHHANPALCTTRAVGLPPLLSKRHAFAQKRVSGCCPQWWDQIHYKTHFIWFENSFLGLL